MEILQNCQQEIEDGICQLCGLMMDNLVDSKLEFTKNCPRISSGKSNIIDNLDGIPMEVISRAKSNITEKETLTGKKVKGLRDLNDEEYLEAYRASIALEQAAQDRVQAMYGEAMQGKWTRNISNAFFNLNILQPWTQTVQMAAFTISKEKTARLAKELATGFDSYGLKLTNKGIKRRKEELRENLSLSTDVPS